jgi:hypothetical protein
LQIQNFILSLLSILSTPTSTVTGHSYYMY